MRRLIFSAVVVCMSQALFSQENHIHTRPSVYNQVDEVRKELNLDRKQFDKVYSAYEKFDKAVFGDSDSRDAESGRPPGDRHGKGRPGGGGHGGPGMGGPGGHGGPRMGGPGGAPGGRPAHGEMAGSNDRKQLPPDLEKLEKTRTKQEEKLDKSMKKLFKKNNELYVKWKALRKEQLQKMSPPFRPTPPEHDTRK